MNVFGLDDWPSGCQRRSHAVHVAYVRAAQRVGERPWQYVDALKIAGRDRWTCSVCGGPVPEHWDSGAVGQAPALTFIEPLELGGRYAKANLRLAHLDCAGLTDPQLLRTLRRALGGGLDAKVRASRSDTHCLKGHELAGANLLKASDGRRRCRRCRNDRERGSANRG